MEFSPNDLLVILVSIVISMGIHEAMHAFVAHWLGDTTASDMGRLTLNPLKHIDIVTTVLLPVILIAAGLPPIFIAKPVPFNPDRVKWDEYGAALIGVAGPLTNLVLAFLASVIVRGNPSTEIASVLLTFIQVNIAFFVFNMIPFPPLDGSRLLYAFAPEPVQRAMRTIESYGLMAIILFFIILVPFLGGIIQAVSETLLRLLLG